MFPNITSPRLVSPNKPSWTGDLAEVIENDHLNCRSSVNYFNMSGNKVLLLYTFSSRPHIYIRIQIYQSILIIFVIVFKEDNKNGCIIPKNSNYTLRCLTSRYFWHIDHARFCNFILSILWKSSGYYTEKYIKRTENRAAPPISMRYISLQYSNFLI